ncbi:helix-turn-helix transcriptional regulator [Cryobacterium sp. PAMC25264]|uniref:ArsR/SmtB family transcription factor n=1 Tax=Cryobacterium sp. PAMC25264 TaxID=2861288 RepID=UPI001C636B44|nr:winged helix-turn-helix domain-containing protein [Cryobacterium sp. PAMC25264]QYF73703.1 winged helix-turn-helix domain-containing protein [Cryobacterium sp. PAMC25264]
MTSLGDHTHELAELRERVEALERAVHATLGAEAAPGQTDADAETDGTERASSPATSSPGTDVFWALNGLKAMAPAPGAVLYTGNVTLPGGGPVDWQYALTTDDILARDWSRPASTSALTALGHPVRLRLLQAIATGTVAVAELAALEGVGTTGQVYHHVNQLIAAGWVYSTSRGHYGIPPERVVPLLTVILAAGGV